MAISTYSELQSAIADELNRQDLSSVIPTWVALAEASFNRVLRHRKMLCRATATLDTQYTALPGDFLEAKNIQLNTSPVTSLEYVTMEEADRLRQTYIQTSTPKYYTIVGDTIEVVPSPGEGQTIELVYYRKITPLSSGAGNWLLTWHPDLYFYASLQHSAPYLKDDPRLSIWSTITSELISQINMESDKSEHSGATLKVRASVLG
jgi:hypothetical protein